MAQATLLLCALGIWFVVRTRVYLAAPVDQDLYAHTWSFQALAFLISYGAAAAVLLLVLIVIELYILISLTSRHEGSQDEPHDQREAKRTSGAP